MAQKAKYLAQSKMQNEELRRNSNKKLFASYARFTKTVDSIDAQVQYLIRKLANSQAALNIAETS
jgi:NADPH-dependent 7-cyano-7-deazaguanine reductase QueF